MKSLFAAFALAGKDLRTELRTKESLLSSASFALVILILFSFSFDLGREEFLAISGGLLWLVYAFAGALIVNRSFTRELPNDCLDVLIASPIPGWSIFLGKAMACFVMLLIVELISLPIFGILYNVHWVDVFFPLMLVICLTSWGITVAGAAFSAVTVNVRLRELMVPVLLYPLLIPLLTAAMELTTGLASGESALSAGGAGIRIMLAFDAIFTALAVYLIEYILVI